MAVGHLMGALLKLVGEVDGMRKRHTVEADTFTVARPNARATGIGGDIDFDENQA